MMTLFNAQASITCDITKDLMRFFLNFSDQVAVNADRVALCSVASNSRGTLLLYAVAV
jgi:hypothetical protein